VIQAVIFDMDGTLVETEDLSSCAFHKVLSDCRIEPTLNAWGCVQDIGTIGNMAKLKEKYGLWQPLWWLRYKYALAYKRVIQQSAEPRPGLIPLLKTLNEHGIPMAVASGSVNRTIEVVVNHLEISHYFQHLVSSRELKRNKPFPDVYLEAARRLRVLPQYCLAVEDAGIGVDAASAAGMKVVAVPNRFTIQDNFSGADIVLQSLEQATWEMIAVL